MAKLDSALIYGRLELYGSGSIVGDLKLNNVDVATVNSNVATATKLQTARTISLTGGITGSATFDGSSNISITTSVVNTSHNHDSLYLKLTGGNLNGNLTLAGSTVSAMDMSVDKYIHIKDYYGASDSKSRIWFNKNNSSYQANTLYMDGGITDVNINGKRVYREGFYPTASNVGALPITGGSITGDFSIDKAANTSSKIYMTEDSKNHGFYILYEGVSHNATYFGTRSSNTEIPFLKVDRGSKILQFYDIPKINGQNIWYTGNFNPDTKYNSNGGTIGGNVVITGNLEVQGTQTIFNTTTMEVEDNIITVAKNNTAGTTTYMGIKAERGSADAYAVFRESDDRWIFATSTDEFVANTSYSNVQAGTFYGALSGNASTATKLQTARTIALTGGVTGSVTFDGTGNVSMNTTVNSFTHNHDSTYLKLTGGTITGTLTATENIKTNKNIEFGAKGRISYNETEESIDFIII